MIKLSKLSIILGGISIGLISSSATFLSMFLTKAIDVSDPIAVTIKIDDEEQQYDGTSLLPSSYSLNSGTLISGDKIVVTYSGGQVDVGTSKSDASVRIVDENDNDVTDKYKIRIEQGDLTITPRAISVAYKFSEFEYGGNIVDASQYDITSGSLAKGDILKTSINFVGKQQIGLVESDQIDLHTYVYNSLGQDVSSNYEIKDKVGSINVVARKIRVEPTVFEKEYDGNNFVIGNNYRISEGSLVGGHTIKSCVCTNKSMSNVGDDYETMIELEIVDEEGNDVTDCYSYNQNELFKITIKGEKHNIILPNLIKPYDGKSFEDELRANILAQIPKNALEYTKITFSERISNFYKFEEYNNRRIIDKDDVTVVSDKYSYSYNIISGSLEITKGMIYISLPELEFTYNFNAITDNDLFNEFNTIYGGNKGSVKIENLVESDLINFDDINNLWFIYDKGKKNVGTYSYSLDKELLRVKDKDGKDVTNSYDISIEGTFRINPMDIYFASDATIEKVYTGDYLTLNSFDVKLYRSSDDYPLEDKVSFRNLSFLEKVKNASDDNYDLTPYLVEIYNSDLENITSNFTIDKNRKIQVKINPVKLTVIYNDATYEKDTDLDLDPKSLVDFSFLSLLKGGDQINLDESFFGGTIIIKDLEVGLNSLEGQVFPQIVFYNSLGESSEIIEKNYEITPVFGSILITDTKQVYTITLPSFTKEYDGEKVFINDLIANLSIPEDINVQLDGPEFYVDAGTYYYTVSASSTKNYEFIISPGVIQINKKVLNITLPNITKDYDGVEVDISSLVGQVSLPTGCYLTPVGENRINAGIYPYSASFVGDDNYEPIITSGTIIINKKVLNITLPNITKDYDGVEVDISSLVGQVSLPTGCSLIPEGSNVIDAGTYTYSAIFSGDDNNYEPIITSGTIIINKKVLNITLPNIAKDYDGVEVDISSLVGQVDLPTGCYLTAVGENVIDAGTYTYSASFSDNDNYETIITSGTIIINKKVLNITLPSFTVSVGTDISLLLSSIEDSYDDKYELTIEGFVDTNVADFYTYTVTTSNNNYEVIATPGVITVQ